MGKPASDSPPNRLPETPSVCISASNFGPIESGSIDLRPMNIFVGPSNTGKTYFATLIYAMHQTTKGFSRLHPIMNYILHDLTDFPEAIHETIKSINFKQKRFHFSDLPESVRSQIQSTLNDPELLAHDWEIELERCFSVDAISELIQARNESKGAQVSLSIKGEKDLLWDFHMGILSRGVQINGSIGDFEILHMIRSLERRAEKAFSSANSMKDIITNLPKVFESEKSDERGVYYLPSDRGGIMHSHRAIAISLIEHVTRSSTRRRLDIPTFSGIMADFMRHIITYEGSELHDEKPEDELKKIASELESHVLRGKIEMTRISSHGYPDVVYRPGGMERNMRLNRASSMVSEIAPMVLFIRSHVRAGDTVIIDEPEAHLHPAAQTEIATILARLVRAGVRVIVTTHSDWLLQEIGNLMREGELGEENGGSSLSPNALRPRDVGAWLFDRKDESKGSIVREISFDRVEGIAPSDYEDVAERLYNRSADLQNRLAEIAINRES